MPFLNSLSSFHPGRGLNSIAPFPSITINATTNASESVATLNATVSANGNFTTITKFEIYDVAAGTWANATGGTLSVTSTSSQNVAVYYNATGLLGGTAGTAAGGKQYQVRLTATNGSGTTTVSSGSGTGAFTTWQLYTETTQTTRASNNTFNIPTVTPTGASAITPSIYDVIIFGGGGYKGTYGSAGGGGGYRTSSSIQVTASGQNIYWDIGAAGSSDGASGGTTTVYGLSGGNFSATGGVGGSNTSPTPSTPTDTYNVMTAGNSSSSGTGTNSAGTAGTGYAYFSSGKDGSIIYLFGGAGGAGGNGGNATSSTHLGGTGGNGQNLRITGGAGGGGAHYDNYTGIYDNANGSAAPGSYNTYGRGASGYTAQTNGTATAGVVSFKYYKA